ncbi:peptidase domain-containing ABC transporter [Saprospiraceae bacterium]|nr:peptidase domain-containing ABC transporter [Saprospiraceae bacterium]MDB4768640.1 peptidase domain-containing ABC transporter [Saprospiraceae bacterium]MDG1433052.1 peptidase domain-containing ABC transporter [Saprospiraceae bacterium]
MTFPHFRQLDKMDCGPTCLRMIAEFYGKSFSLQYLREHCYLDREGVSLQGICEGAEHIGMNTFAAMLPLRSDDGEGGGLVDAPLPAIVHWDQNHFVVVYKINKKYIWVADPGKGRIKYKISEFNNHWLSGKETGIALLLEPTPEFYAQEGETLNRTGLTFLFKYLRPYRKLMVQLLFGLLFGSMLQLIFPFLTQSIVDVGIENQNINFIYLILGAQLMLFLSQASVGIIQNWILLHIGTRVNIALLSDFLFKLMRLPIAFFDTKMTGDLLQRIQDHKRIELFMAGSTLSAIFSFFNLIVFGIILLYYNITIFVVFLSGSFFYILWVLIFMKKRREIDHLKFEEQAENQSKIIELIQGMQEIKLQNSERKRRWEWTEIQAKLFRANMKSLTITQYQDTGTGVINQLKDIFISFIAAKAVIDGSMTLGMMLAVQYIVGQLNAPLIQMINFIRSSQDATLSLERLGEIHGKDDEESNVGNQIEILPETSDIVFENISFQYNKLSDLVLRDINLTIPKGKVTAIVGTSGSGKTTLVKLILGFYEATHGNIRVGGFLLKNFRKKMWRQKCGAVMQDGYIFSDTIANNIGESEDVVNKDKLLNAVQLAHIQEFIETMPLGYNTIIGSRGNGISQGQKQRLLIARAVYKNPEYLFFDEATNALDTENERIITENLEQFFSGRTVVVVAHRLSTVRNADQIIVLEKGRIIEQGSHEDLIVKKGSYFNLVKNQLELGE